MKKFLSSVILLICCLNLATLSVIRSGQRDDIEEPIGPIDQIDINATAPVAYPPNSTVCFDGPIGCFSNAYPFNNAQNYLPTTPRILNTEFFFYNQNNLDQEIPLSYEDVNTIKNSGFDPELPLKLIIHGFGNNKSTPWIHSMKNEILQYEKVNLIVVAWGNGCPFPYYPNSTANTRLVGRLTSILVNTIRNLYFASSPRKLNVHCIGHSLGAHTCGYASNSNVTSIRFNRISGLDPAGPNFEDTDEIVRLDPSDADFVDVIHTNGNTAGLLSGSFGIVMSSGHVDFYVNGGQSQPGCPGLTSIISGAVGGTIDPTKEVGCSHNRVQIYFTESIASSCSFVGFNCPNKATFDRGECISCKGNRCSVMGYHAIDFKGRGTMFLNTNDNSPFCSYHHLVQLDVNSKSPKTAGTVLININSQPAKLLDGDDIKASTSIRKVFMTPHDLINVNTIQLSFNKKSTFLGLFPNADSFVFDKIKLVNLEADETFSACAESTSLQTNSTIELNIKEEDCRLN